MTETKKRILIMDDEDMVGEIACQMLEFIGFEGVHVLDGGTAIEEYTAYMKKGEPFVAVIMDLTIPGGMGGQEAISELLAIDSDAKVFVSSGYSSDPAMLNYAEYGFAGVIAKPFDLNDLQRILKTFL